MRIIMDLQNFNSLNIDYKWKVHSFTITDLDIISYKIIFI